MANPARTAPSPDVVGDRLYHSPSSDAIGQLCEMSWFLGYKRKRREPEITWEQACSVRLERGRPVLTVRRRREGGWMAHVTDLPEIRASLPTSAEAADRARLNFFLARSKALGAENHGRLDAWYHGARLDTSDLPGQIVESGLHHLPTPEECARGETEHELGDIELPDAEPGRPSRAFEYNGVLWVAKPDLIARLSSGAWARLDMPTRLAADRWAIFDYKNTAQIFDNDQRPGFAKKPGVLRADVQACMYGWAATRPQELDLPRIAGRWVYFETKKVRRSHPVTVVLERDACEEVVAQATDRARHLDLIRDEKDARMNSEACAMFGGCPHHVSAGGPCNAPRPASASVLERVRKAVATMGLKKSSVSKFTAAKKAAEEEAPAPKRGAKKAPKVEEPEEDEDESEAEEPEADDTDEDADDEPAPAPKKRRSKKDAAAIGMTWDIDGAGTVQLSGDPAAVLHVVQLLRSAEQA